MKNIPSLLFSLAITVTDVSQAQNVESVLEANRKALGEVARIGVQELTYQYVADGLSGDQTIKFDLTTGAFAEIDEANSIRIANGYDGSVPWQQDISGAYAPQQGGDRVPVAVSAAYRHANLWSRSDRGGATIEYAGRESQDGQSLDHLIVTPQGGKRFDAWFNSETHLLTKVAEDRQFFHYVETYSDYRPEAGVNLAHKIVVDPGVGDGGLTTSTLTKSFVGPARPLTDYAYSSAPPMGAIIMGGADKTKVPFRLLNNHVYVQATVNGKGPYTFIVDTGGHTLLGSRIVSEAGLKPVGQSVESGAGEGHSTTGFVHYDEIAIGAVRLQNQMGFATEVYKTSIEGIPVDGMIGFELLRRMVTTIDYGHHTITFTDPARFEPGSFSGVAVPFVFYDHLPNVVGFIGDLAATFDIDTGSRSEIDITSPFVVAHQLRARFAKGATAVTGWGVGGPTRNYVFRLPKLTLGTVEVDNVVAGLSDAKHGSFSDPNYDGNIGSALLKQFVVSFDYANRVMYLKRITPQPPDVGTFDRSGLWINALNGGYTITDVAENSAGSRAGLTIGDVITAIGGKPVHDEGLADARRMLRKLPPGTHIRLLVRRAETTRSVTLTLEDQI